MKHSIPHSRRPARGRRHDSDLDYGVRRGRLRRGALRMERRWGKTPDTYQMFDDEHKFITTTIKRVDGKFWMGMVVFKDEFSHLLEPI